ncbi:MAG: hypothetical protein RL653_2993 [Pseudomonadota bacterium]|jgi:hypothetical protein
MMRVRFLASVLVLGLATGAWAGPSVAEAERSVAAAREGVTAVRARQQSVRGELSQVARRIEAAKAGGAGVLPRAELDGLLQRSQELSNELTQLAQRLSAEEAKALSADQVLLDALAVQLAALRTKALEAPRAERPALVTQLKRLREQQSRVLARLPAASVPALPTRASDDPEELLEQADALRDGEDKVRARMELVRQRLAQAQAARELDRRMGDFSRDDALFDDSDRRFRLRREVASDTALDRAQPAQGNNGTEFQSTAAGPAAPAAPSDAAPLPGNSNPQGGTTVVSAKDSLPQVGRNTGGVPALAEDDVGVLEAELKRLQRQAVDLSSRAQELEKKAQSLGGR